MRRPSGGQVKAGRLAVVLGLVIAFALAALWWRAEREPEGLPLPPETAASFDASGDRISQQLQDSLDRELEQRLAELPNAVQDASDASSRLRSAERALSELPDIPENAGVRAALEREIAAERALIEAAGVSAAPED
jgi:hypothetical protein